MVGQLLGLSSPLRECSLILGSGIRYYPRGDWWSAEVRSAEVRSAEVRSAEVRSAEVRSAEVRSAEVRSVEVSSAEVRSAEVRSAEEMLMRLAASLTWSRASEVQDSHILPLQCAACRLVAFPNDGGDVQGL